MAAPDFFSQLPSLEELLEHPRVASAVERLNQSTAAARVRSAVSGIGAEVARRAEELQSLTPGELLERVIKRLGEPRQARPTHTINATGDPLGGEWTQAPLPAVAIEAMHTVSSGYHRGAAGEAATVAQRLIGGEAAVAFSSHSAALAISLEALASGGVCLVARREMSELAPGVRLDDVCRRAGVTLREVGAIDAATLEDYRAAVEPQADRLVVLRRSELASEPSIAELAGLPGVTLIVDASSATPRRDTPGYGESSPSAEECLKAGAAAVLLNAAGRIGGPPAGLVVGRSNVIAAVTGSSVARVDGIAPVVDAALSATLELFATPDTLRFTHPLYELLDAPLESLHNRAERLAPRIAAGAGIASVAVVERTGASGTLSWALRVEPADQSGQDLADKLSGREPSIVASVEGEAVLIDLRAVFAREDRALAAAFDPETTPVLEPGNHPSPEVTE